jgi:hypothetical protein
MNRNAPNRRKSQEPGTVKLEVIHPKIRPGMKQADEFSGSGIKSGNVRAFKPIAMEAGHG